MATPKSNGPLEPITVGVDVGNATTSVATAAGVVAFFPSVLTTFGVGPYGGLSKISTSQHHIAYGDTRAIIGADAFEMQGAYTLLREGGNAHERYTDEPSLLCFLAGISAAFPEADTLGIRLATGAPLSLFEAYGADIARRYQGAHEYQYNGHARRVVVERVTVYGEGREAWRLLTSEQRRGNVAIHDVGGRTWNVLFFKDGNLKRYETFNMGVDRLLNTVPAVARDAGLRWDLQVELRQNAKAHAGLRRELDRAVTEALKVIERKLALPQAGLHCVMGGGALYLAAPLKARYGKPVLTIGGDAPETANARAYALAASEA